MVRTKKTCYKITFGLCFSISSQVLFSLKFKKFLIKEIISVLWEVESKVTKICESPLINVLGLYIRLSIRNSKHRSIKKQKLRGGWAGGGSVS